jgi:hypothetical protein
VATGRDKDPTPKFIVGANGIKIARIKLIDRVSQILQDLVDGESSILASGAWISTFTDHPIRSRLYVGWDR